MPAQRSKASNDAAKDLTAMPAGIAAALTGNPSVAAQLRISVGNCFSSALTDVKKTNDDLFKTKNQKGSRSPVGSRAAADRASGIWW